MKHVKRLLSLLIVLFLLTGCSVGSTTSTSTNDPAQGTTESLKVLNVGRMTELFDMDSGIATEADCLEVISAIIEPLYVNDTNGVPKPALAESFEMSDDGTVYTFHIRKDAVWSNDAPVTAHDFVFAWRRLVDPVTASEYSFMMEVAAVNNATAVITGEKTPDQLGVSAKDDKTLVVKLDRPVPFFQSLMTFPSFCPINQAFYEEKGDQYALGANNLLFCGPFIMSAWEVGGSTYSLAKNPKYYNPDVVKLDQINFQIIKDNQQTMLAYESGKLDYARLSGELITQYEKDPGFRLIEEGYLWYLSPNLNPSDPTYSCGLENENLRKAIALSFDKTAICEEILKDGSVPANFAIPNKLATGPDGKDFRATSGTWYQTDKSKAKEYWELAKEELGVDTVTIELLFDDSDSTPLVAQYLQSEIENTLPGVIMTLKSQPKKSRTELMQNREYELGLTRWGPDYADPMTYLDMWVSDATYNYGSWNSPEYDVLIEKATTGDYSTDLPARWEALKQAEALVMEEAVILPVYQKGSAVMVRPSVSGMSFYPVGVGTIYTSVDITE